MKIRKNDPDAAIYEANWTSRRALLAQSVEALKSRLSSDEWLRRVRAEAVAKLNAKKWAWHRDNMALMDEVRGCYDKPLPRAEGD